MRYENLNFYLQEVAKRTVTKSMLEIENGDDEDEDFGDEDLFHQKVIVRNWKQKFFETVGKIFILKFDYVEYHI